METESRTQTCLIIVAYYMHYNETRWTVSISSGQWNLMKTYHNEANTGGITKIALNFFLKFFEQSR